MTTSLPETSPTTRARVLGAFYLFLIISGVVAQAVISDRMVVANDAVATAANITGNRSLYRLAYTIFMLEMLAQIVVIAMFYDLLKPVNRSLARITTVIGLTGAGIKTLARLFFYSPLLFLGSASLASITQPQVETLSLMFLRMNDQGAAIALIFFGFETILRGWLIFKSGFLPRFLGVISMIGGIGWLTWLWPPLGSQAFMVVALFALMGVLTTVGWFFLRGVDDARWRAQAALAANSIWR